MTTNIEIFQPWKKILPEELLNIYRTVINLEEQSFSTEFELKQIEKSTNEEDTEAEKYGRSIRYRFYFYQAFLNLIKREREWIVIERHSAEHCTYNNDYVKINGYEIQAFHFDTAAFDFKWRDNTLDTVFKPWNWEIDLIPNDLDDDHLFYCPNNGWLVRSFLRMPEGNPAFQVFARNFASEINQSLQKWVGCIGNHSK